MTSVISGGGRCGFVLPRGPRGYEAFGADCESLGLFDTQQAAIDAVLRTPPASADALASLAREGESA
jgi:hypothetical protein